MELVKIETIGNTTYLLYSNIRRPHSWFMKKVVDDNGVVEVYYADTSNNSGIKSDDFDTAWQNRATLNYSYYYAFK